MEGVDLDEVYAVLGETFFLNRKLQDVLVRTEKVAKELQEENTKLKEESAGNDRLEPT